MSATSSESPNTLALIENVDMVQHMLDSELAGGPLLAHTCIHELIAKVCIFPFVIFHDPFLLVCFIFSLLLFFHEVLIVGWGRLFPCEHLDYNSQGPRLALHRYYREFAGADVPAWNKLHESSYEYFFAFAKSNLYDHGVLVLAHCARAFVSRIVFYWAHTYNLYVTED